MELDPLATLLLLLPITGFKLHTVYKACSVTLWQDYTTDYRYEQFNVQVLTSNEKPQRTLTSQHWPFRCPSALSGGWAGSTQVSQDVTVIECLRRDRAAVPLSLSSLDVQTLQRAVWAPDTEQRRTSNTRWKLTPNTAPETRPAPSEGWERERKQTHKHHTTHQ